MTTTAAFSVGNCVILNCIDKPCGRLVAVVVGIEGDYLLCKYLNADRSLDSYNKKPMKALAEKATKLLDFGVQIIQGDGEYWCVELYKSSATYADGEPRKWQEACPIKICGRPKLMDLVFGQKADSTPFYDELTNRQKRHVDDAFKRAQDRLARAAVADYATAYDMLEKLINDARTLRRMLKKTTKA